MARGRVRALAEMGMAGCSSPNQKAAAHSCLQFQDAATGVLATTPGNGWSADVDDVVSPTPRSYSAGARAAPRELAADMRHAADLASLHGVTRALSRSTAGLIRKTPVSMTQVQASCPQEGTTIDHARPDSAS